MLEKSNADFALSFLVQSSNQHMRGANTVKHSHSALIAIFIFSTAKQNFNYVEKGKKISAKDA